jgi:hypothetical protein
LNKSFGRLSRSDFGKDLLHVLEKKVESFWVEESGLNLPMHDYQDERCSGTTIYIIINKYIWQNTFNRLRYYILKKKAV